MSNYDSTSLGWAFISFLIPLLGLILWLVWKDNYPMKASSCGKGALICVILSVGIPLLVSCFTFLG